MAQITTMLLRESPLTEWYLWSVVCLVSAVDHPGEKACAFDHLGADDHPYLNERLKGQANSTACNYIVCFYDSPSSFNIKTCKLRAHLAAQITGALEHEHGHHCAQPPPPSTLGQLRGACSGAPQNL